MADTDATARALGDLPPELIERILGFLDPPDLARANGASRLFRGAPGDRSPVEHALRERARARGHERTLRTARPDGECTWTEELFAREAVLGLANAHALVVAVGSRRDRCFSAFVDVEGGLHACGEGPPNAQQLLCCELLGLGVAAGHSVVAPTRVTSLGAARVRSVAAGSLHLLALSEAGAVYGCGDNRYGQLGLGDRTMHRGVARVEALAGVLAVGIAAGANHSLALTAAGCAYSWGYNQYGQLGHGDTANRLAPTRIEALDGVRVGGVAAAGFHTLLLSTSGAVYSCGCGCYGQLGHASTRDQWSPRRIEASARCAEPPAAVRAVHVDTAVAHSLLVDAAGNVHSFGLGSAGALGHDDRSVLSRPRRVEALAGVRAVRASCGLHGSAVVCADGSVRVFGTNGSGELGVGEAVALGGVTEPVRVDAFGHARVVACSLDEARSLYVTADGAVHACGEQSAALGLGVGATAGARAVRTPTRLEGLPRVHAR